jgi:hypothetical protein
VEQTRQEHIRLQGETTAAKERLEATQAKVCTTPFPPSGCEQEH